MRIRGEGSQEFSGTVGPAGDFDGDGYADFVIGATGQQQDTSGKVPGNVFLIFGAKAWPDRIALRDLRGRGIKIHGRTDDFTVVGGVVGRQGDLNGDGRADFAFTENDILTPIGDRVFVIYGQGVDRPFVRGDGNGDGTVDVSDAASMIGYLFLGTGAPPCEDAGLMERERAAPLRSGPRFCHRN